VNVREMAAITKTSTEISRAISFDLRLFPAWEINVEWNPRLKTSYGRGGPTHYGIKLHPAIKTYPDQLRRTFLHELAHCMEYLLYHTCGHGQGFWEAMIRLGEKPWEKNQHEFSLHKYNRDKAIAADIELKELGL
jgi:predicted SprT family Zn-dependent metalloprotease